MEREKWMVSIENMWMIVVFGRKVFFKIYYFVCDIMINLICWFLEYFIIEKFKRLFMDFKKDEIIVDIFKCVYIVLES